MQRTVVLDVVGLTADLIRRGAPRLARWAQSATLATVESAFPAVTCTAQSDYLTGRRADGHGIVGNGWYERAECEVRFWRQSNKLVQGPKIWERARAENPSFTCANLFWWFNMYSSVDISVTPRPMYLADGRKLPDVYTAPADLRDRLQQKLGTFPLFDFWGPRASIASTRWIAEASKLVEIERSPTLTLVYLPHLDYNLQRVGVASAAALDDVGQVDAVCGDLIDFYEARGVQVIVLSEYGIRDVSRPVHINRVLRRHGHLAVRTERGRELLDAGASAAFAVADHQVAHVYINDPSRASAIRQQLENTAGIERVLDAEGRQQYGIDHPRSGELVAIAGACRRCRWAGNWRGGSSAFAPCST
jgi:predicted AlkP superfamily pyrophosphatase or phosphodiesterase